MSQKAILCIDDEQIVLDSLKTQLKKRFGNTYFFEFAESGEEGLEILEELVEDDYIIAMIISDQIMPGLTGDQLLVHVHQTYPRTIKVLLTGQAATESAINAINNADLYRYLTKPWDEEDFLLTVEKGLAQYALIERLEQQNSIFRKFVPTNFLKFLEKEDIIDIRLGDNVERKMSILFSDIRSFTTISEKMTPEENFRFLNSYLSQMGPMIREHNGFIDKYIGDAIMALFGESPEDAVKAAIAMIEMLATYNTGRGQAGYPAIEIGIGVNTGSLMLGTIGESDRMEGTVISDAVNLASRIESLTKFYGTSLLVSEYTFSKLTNPDQYSCRFIDRVKVRGKTEPVDLHEIFDGDPPDIKEKKQNLKAIFQNAWEVYQAKSFQEAESLFKECLTHYPEDKASQVYIERCQQLLTASPDDSWDGVTQLD